MIFIWWPLMVCALVPIVIVEAVLVRRWLSITYSEAFIGITKANLLSTFVGVPLSWLIMFAAQIVIGMPLALFGYALDSKLLSPVLGVVYLIVSVAWLPPAWDERHLYWMVPLATALLLIPCFFVSIRLERWVCLRSWPNSDPDAVRDGVYHANIISYIVLFALAMGWMFCGIALMPER
jgi:hypothetical protein